MRPHLLFFLLLLSACADTGTGGIPANPGAVAWSAAGTATAAAINVTSTAVSANATISAAYYQATAQAQAAAAQSTAVAMPTVTAQAELQSVAAQEAAELAAIRVNLARVGAEATAVHVRAQIAQDAARAQRGRDVAVFWAYARVVFLTGAALVVWGAYKYVMPGIYARLVPSQDVVIDSNGNLVAVGRGYSAVAQPPPVDIQDIQEPPPPEHVYETLVNVPGGTFTVLSPTPAGFVTWLAEVLDNPRAEFSNNERRRRGWPETHFWKMIGDMKRIGWMNNKPDSRGCYTMTEAGKVQARVWLSPPPP